MTKKEACKRARAAQKPRDPLAINAQQELFCQEYLIDRNGTRSAIRAGYSAKTAGEQASRLLADVRIKHRINQLISQDLQRIEATAAKIKRELTNIAFVNIADAYDANGSLKKFEDMPIELQRAILAIEADEIYSGRGEDRKLVGYTKRLKLTDKIKALELLGRHQKMFTDVVAHEVNLDQLATLMDEAEKRAGIWKRPLPPPLQAQQPTDKLELLGSKLN